MMYCTVSIIEESLGAINYYMIIKLIQRLSYLARACLERGTARMMKGKVGYRWSLGGVE